MNPKLFFAFVLITAFLMAATAPAQEPVDKLFGKLFEQDEFRNARMAEVLKNYKVGGLLNLSLQEASATVQFVKDWPTDYEKNQGGKPGGMKPAPADVSSFKGKQQRIFRDLLKAAENLDNAAVEVAGKKAWPEWLLLTRGFLQVAKSVPDYPCLLGIEQNEAEELAKLREFIHKAVLKRQNEWRDYLKSDKALKGGKREAFDRARSDLHQYVINVAHLEAKLSTQWEQHVSNSELWRKWWAFFAKEAEPSKDKLKKNATIKPSGRRVLPPGTTDARKTYTVRRDLFIAWPYVLAEHLKLGDVVLTYDALGFDANAALSLNKPVLTPRIRIRGVFEFNGSPKDALPAVDVRLSGKDVNLRDLLPGDWAAKKEDPIPKEIRNATKAIVGASEQQIINDLFEELTADGQENRAVEFYFGKPWDRVEPRPVLLLEEKWLEQVNRVQNQLSSGGTALRGSAPGSSKITAEVAALTGNTRSMRESILRHMQTDAKSAIEESLRQITGGDTKCVKAREQMKLVVDTIRNARGDATQIRAPEIVLFDAATLIYEEWSLYLAGMLPDPTVGGALNRHPWPERFAPELLARKDFVHAAIDPARREIDRLLFAQIAGSNRDFATLLEELSKGLQPTETHGLQPSEADFRDAEFLTADSLRKKYAEVDRLLLINDWGEVEKYVRNEVTKDGRILDLAGRGYGIAQLFLACWQEGTETAKPEVVKWYWKAARRGIPHAQFVLAERYEHGVGVAKDPAAAAEVHQKAVSQRGIYGQRGSGYKQIELFNGKDLTGWEGHEEYWSVKDGVIIGKNTETVPLSTYLLTKRKFRDFRLIFDFKLAVSEMHSGIAFWGGEAPGVRYTYAGHLVMFPSGYGFYELYGRRGIHANGDKAQKVGKQHDWNHMEILAQGDRIRFVLNGVLISDWQEPEPKRIQEGQIGLQLHSNKEPQEVQFKNLVLETSPEDKLTTVKESEVTLTHRQWSALSGSGCTRGNR